VLVAAPVLPALPALGLADRADHRSQRGAHVLGLAQAAAYLVLEREQLLLAPAMGDLPRDAAVSAETPFGVEKRVTARAEVADTPVRAHASILVVEEGLTRVRLRLKRRAVCRIDLDSRHLPSRLPDERARISAGLGGGPAEELREA